MSAIGHVSENLIQEILARVEISELIGRFVKLKKTGVEASGLCPFHHEKSPSFTVSIKKQFFHCFGCGAHGDSIAFLMQHQGLTFVDAVESLADSVGIELPKVKGGSSRPTESLKPLHEVLKAAAIFYHQQWKTPQAKAGIDYLKQRGLTKELVNQFAIGFAQDGWEHLNNHLLAKGFSQDIIKTAGLVSDNKKGGVYDKFRHRIIFPIRDIKGRVLGFGGRAMGDDKPKYLNSPATPVFHKSECLYGLFEARARGNRVVLVEGYMDVIALAQHQIPALATLGTAVNENHLKHLFRYYDHVVFCFDGDAAGQKAAYKACLSVMPLKDDHRQIDFMHMPAGQDPDTFIRSQGPAVFLRSLDEAKVFSDYFFDSLTQEIPPTSLDNRARLVKKAQPILAKLPNGVFKGMMLDRLNTWKYEKKPPFRSKAYSKPTRRADKLKKTLSPCETLSLILCRHPAWLTMIEDVESLVEHAQGNELFNEVIHQITTQPNIETVVILDVLAKKNPQWSRVLENRPWVILPEEALEEEFLGAISRLMSQNERKKRQILLEKAKNGELSEEDKKMLKKVYKK